jgi:hypothetical protein
MIPEVLGLGIHLPIRRCKFHQASLRLPYLLVASRFSCTWAMSKVPPCQLDTLLLGICCVMDVEKGATLAEFEV